MVRMNQTQPNDGVTPEAILEALIKGVRIEERHHNPDKTLNHLKKCLETGANKIENIEPAVLGKMFRSVKTKIELEKIMKKIVKQFEKNGNVGNLTYRQAVAVIAKSTGNLYEPPNPFDADDIKRAENEFGDDNTGNFPSIHPEGNGGFSYCTIHTCRSLTVVPDEDNEGKWILDCSGWWSNSKSFRSEVVGGLEEVLKDKSLARDKSLPKSFTDIDVSEEVMAGVFQRLANDETTEEDTHRLQVYFGVDWIEVQIGNVVVQLDHESSYYGGPNSGGNVGFRDFAEKENEGEADGVKWELWQTGRHYFNDSSFRHNVDEYEDEERYHLLINGTVKIEHPNLPSPIKLQ